MRGGREGGGMIDQLADEMYVAAAVRNVTQYVYSGPGIRGYWPRRLVALKEV